MGQPGVSGQIRNGGLLGGGHRGWLEGQKDRGAGHGDYLMRRLGR